jgi:hypothetical protein
MVPSRLLIDPGESSGHGLPGLSLSVAKLWRARCFVALNEAEPLTFAEQPPGA